MSDPWITILGSAITVVLGLVVWICKHRLQHSKCTSGCCEMDFEERVLTSMERLHEKVEDPETRSATTRNLVLDILSIANKPKADEEGDVQFTDRNQKAEA